MHLFPRVISLFLLFAALAGCRSDPSVALLEAEMRWLEDQYYALEGEYQLKCQELESCRLAHQAFDDSPRADRGDQGEELPPSSRRRSGDPRPDQSPPIEPPRIEGIPGLNSPTPAAQSDDRSGPDLLELPAPQGSGVTPSSHTIPIDTRVTHILLNRQLTGGYDRDGHPGDDGVMVVIQPRNAAGQFVPVAGEVTIKLVNLDELNPQRATFARWKLTPRQAAGKMKQSLLGRGVHLELAWPGSPPKTDEFELEVAYTVPGGKQLTAQRTIHINPPRDASTRWTPVSDVHAAPPVDDPAGERYDAAQLAQPGLPSPAMEARSGPLPQNTTIDAPTSWSPQR